MRIKKIFYFSVTLLIGVLLVACERTKISEINADPGRYMNKEVAVAGQVTQSIVIGPGAPAHDVGF